MWKLFSSCPQKEVKILFPKKLLCFFSEIRFLMKPRSFANFWLCIYDHWQTLVAPSFCPSVNRTLNAILIEFLICWSPLPAAMPSIAPRLSWLRKNLSGFQPGTLILKLCEVPDHGTSLGLFWLLRTECRLEGLKTQPQGHFWQRM